VIDTLYRSRTSLLHRYDCRLKLFLLPLMTVFFFLPLSAAASALYSVSLLLAVLVLLGGEDLLIPLKMIFPLLLLILILTPLFNRDGEVLLRAGQTALVSDRGLQEALIYICRFTGISFLFFIFFRTTPMEDILLGLRWYRLPYTAVLVISIALRYIPHLAGLYSQIRAAHALRQTAGGRRSRGLGRIRNLFPVLVSLMIQSVKTIPVLTMALELKGIGREGTRSRYRTLPPAPAPLLQLFFSFLLLVSLLSLLLVF
jgi:energy-coupling factor transport system permease protein